MLPSSGKRKGNIERSSKAFAYFSRNKLQRAKRESFILLNSNYNRKETHMATLNVNVNSLQGKGALPKAKNNGRQSKFSGFRKGTLVDGVISKVSDSISINLNGIEVQVEASAIQNATEGETRTFEIMDVSNTGIALKEVGQSRTAGNPTGIIHSTAVVKQAAQLIATAEEKRKEQEQAEHRDKTQASAGDISSRMTGSDYGSIAAKEGSVEGMDINAFDAALERAKEVHSIEQSMTSVNHASNFVPKEFRSDARQSMIAAKLMMANLPPTAANVTQITQELDNLEVINQMSDRTISYIVEMGLEPTAENLYRGSYAGILSFSNISENAWQALQETAEDVIKKAGLEVDARSIKNARWLLSNDLPLDEKSMQTVTQLQDVRGTLEEEDCVDRMIDRMAKGFNAKTAVLIGGETPDPYVNKDLSNMTQPTAIGTAAIGSQGLDAIAHSPVIEPPFDTTDLTENMMHLMLGQAGASEIAASNAGIISKLSGISDDAVTKNVLQNRDMTLGNLIHSQDEINSGDVSWRSIPMTPGNALAEIRAKRQLEEIRLKMTTEAGNRLAVKGIRLDTTILQKVVEGLREIEQEYYRSYQNGTANANTMQEKLALFQKTTEAVFSLQQVPAFILGMSVDNKDESTLTSLSDDASGMNLQRMRASSVYEALSTEVRKDLGDSIKKAFKNVDNILEDMKLESTEANQRAVRILGYNNLEITEESINEMKQYDGEVNYTLSKLHPAVAISMIRDGLNPLDMPIPELNDQIDAIREREGITTEKKYTSYLWKLEKSEHFSKEEKSAFIGIYRLINAIRNSDGAAVGSVVDTGKELTLHNLLQAVRTLQNSGVNETVNDGTGISQNPEEQKDSIVKQIMKGYVGKVPSDAESAGGDSVVADYAGTVAGNILDAITPDKLNSIWRELEGGSTESKMNNLLSMSLEKFAEQIKNAEQTVDGTRTDVEYNNAAAEHIRDILEGSDEAIDYLLERELPVSANMIDAVRQLGSGRRKFFEELNKQAEQAGEDSAEMLSGAAEQLVEAFTDEESAKEAYEGFTDAAKEATDTLMQSDSFTADDTWGLRSMNNMISLISVLAEKREQYQVPVQTGDGSVTSVNLTLIRGAGEKGKVHVDIDSEQLGEIHADYKINKGRISGFIICSSRAGQDALKGQDRALRDRFQSSGLVLGSMNYVLNGASTEYRADYEASDPASGVDTRVLYQTAKAVIQAVKAAENG